MSVWMAIVVAALPVWSLNRFPEWEPPTARHGALFVSLRNARLHETEPEGLRDRPNSGGWMPCTRRDDESFLFLSAFNEIHTTSKSDTIGGLNQQRMGISDAVAVAKILNATLVLPHFDVNPVWRDFSPFADIFDVDHLLDTLILDVHIVSELPREFAWSTRE